MKQELVIKQAATMPLITVKRWISLILSTCLLLVCSFTVFSQTVVSNETFPNQFNINFPSNNQSNGTFTGSTGTWTASANSRAAIAVIQAYYSPSTYAIKLVNWNTSGVGSGDCHAASPTVNLSSYNCSSNLNLSFKLYSYTCSSSDPNSTFHVEYSTDNGSNWTSVWSMSAAQIRAAYGSGGLTTITVDIPTSYRVSTFKYRFSGYKPANEPHNFYLFVDDAKINATACCDPNDPTAGNGTSFCAPAPNCSAGNFLWSQSITQSNGNPSVVRLFDGGTTSYLIPVNTYPALLTAGYAVTVNISDVVSYDGYAARNTVSQDNERWRLQFRKNGNVVHTTSFTNDLTDNVKQAYWRGSLGTVDLPNGADQIYIQHWSVANSGQGPNSVVPVSVCMSVTVTPPVTNPDFNSTFVNVPVPGNVNTNDKVPAGTTYGTSPTLLSSPAGSSPSITMNPDGTYSFVSNVVGVYIYDVPVCVPGQTAPCPPTKLTITVLDATSNSNAPVANVDIATTNVNTPVTLRSLINDAAGNTANALVPASVTVTVAPLHGTASVNPATGDITYTPANGYTGTDTLTYQVCDDQSPAKCATANQIITIKPAASPNTTQAADDYKITQINTPATGNVKTNDTDAEGNTQTVTAQNTTIAGKGTLVLGTDGSYTFTPVTGFTGPVDFPYTTCDNGTPQACAAATLHILVKPVLQVPDLTPSIFNDGTTLIQNTTRDNVIRIFNIGTGATSGTIIFTVPKMMPAYEITINATETFMDVFGGLPVANNDWTIVEEASRYVFTSKPGVVIAGGGGSKDVGVKVKAIGIKSSTANLSVRIVFGTGGGETPFNNNADNNTYSTN